MLSRLSDRNSRSSIPPDTLTTSVTKPKDQILSMLRRATLAVLFVAPLISYFIPAILVMGVFTWSDITSDPGGFVSFLFMLFNPYIGLTALVGWLGRTRVRASILLVASIIIGGSGAYLWYDLLVRDTSVFRFLGLLSVGILQWYGIIATTVVLLFVWAVEKHFSRNRTLGIFILSAMICSGCADQPAPPRPVPESEIIQASQADIPPAAVVQDLAWQFVITTEVSDLDSTIRHRFVSTEPIQESSAGNIFLRASLTATSFDDPPAAASAFTVMARQADPDTGLTYAWDQLVLDGSRILHLHADCLFSEEAFEKMAANLQASIGGSSPKSLRCRCGGGCDDIDSQ